MADASGEFFWHNEDVDAQGLLDWVSAVCPDVVLLDWELPGLQRKDALSILRARCLHLKVIALSGRPEARRSALAAGADAFVCKCDPPERLLAAIADCWERVKQQAALTGLGKHRWLADLRRQEVAGAARACPDWFDGFTITQQANDETLLTSTVADQAALPNLEKLLSHLTKSKIGRRCRFAYTQIRSLCLPKNSVYLRSSAS